MKENKKLIVVLGQTATGKSDFAVQIAKEVGGEIISADSRQVYKGLDIGSGKITKREMKGVSHHLLNVASPKKVFTVADYTKLANKKIKEIYSRGNTPIVCGGTGFYIDSLTSGQTLPEVPPNKELRKNLEALPKESLLKILKKLDKNRAETIDKNNPVRLIRAIEIATAIGKVPKLGVGPLIPYDVLYVGLALPDEVLKNNIYYRLLFRIKKGMVKEVKDLHEKTKISWKRMEDLGLEYRYCALYLQNKITKKEMLEKLNTEIWHYAKRQKTWFKRNKKITWIDPREIHEKAKVVRKVKEFLKN